MEGQSNEAYGFKLKILNIELIDVSLSASNMSGRHAAISTVIVIAVVTLIGVYGKYLVDLYNYVIK